MTIKYNIKEMEELLKNACSPILSEIRRKFISFLNAIAKNGLTSKTIQENPQLEVYNLTDHSSLDKIFSSSGFYIIFTDYFIKNNKSSLQLDNELTAIYRGECSSVKRRIESHLFNSKYNDSYERRKFKKINLGEKFSEPYYGACIKIDPSISGINIDTPDYSNSKWTVLVLKMPGSTSPIRKQAELAFDDAFNKPIASRE